MTTTNLSAADLGAEIHGLMQLHASDGDVKAGNRLMEIADQLTAELVCGCATLDELLDKWTEGYRPTLKGSPKALLLADIYDFVSAKRRLAVTAYRGLDAGTTRRATPNAIEALEGAIEMLTNIKGGGSYNVVEYIERLDSYRDALNDLRHQANIEKRNREQLAAVRRAS